MRKLLLALIFFFCGGIARGEEPPRQWFCVKVKVLKLLQFDGPTPVYQFELNGKLIRAEMHPRALGFANGQTVLGNLVEIEPPAQGNQGRYFFTNIQKEKFCKVTRKEQLENGRELLKKLKLGMRLPEVEKIMEENNFFNAGSNFNEFVRSTEPREALAIYYGHPAVRIKVPFYQEAVSKEKQTSKLEIWDAYIDAEPRLEETEELIFQSETFRQKQSN